MSTATYPTELKYHKEHDWARIEDDVAEFGITWYAQDSLGDVVFFDPKDIGTQIEAGGSYGELESVKAVSDLVAPLDGEIVAINQDVVDQPELVNSDAYSNWLVRVKLAKPDQVAELLSADEYQELLD